MNDPVRQYLAEIGRRGGTRSRRALAPKLRQLGIRVPEGLPHPEEALFDRLEEMHGDGAHSRYNALIRRLVSFARAAAIAGRSYA